MAMKTVRSSGMTAKDVLSNPVLQGITSLAGLAGTVLGSLLLVRIAGIVVLTVSICLLLFRFRYSLGNIARWLSWKFVIGLVAGIIAGVIWAYVFQPTIEQFLSFLVHKVEVVSSNPPSWGTLPHPYSSLEVDLSRRVSYSLLSSFLVRVQITPRTPLRLIWLYDQDPAEGSHELLIEPAGYVAGSGAPQFEGDTEYVVKIAGLLIKTPVQIVFRTPKS